MYDVIAIGDATRDIFITPIPEEIDLIKPKSPAEHVERFICFEYGEKVTVENAQFDIGGSACNVAVGLHRLGLKAAFVGGLGEDENAQDILGRLEKEGVETKFVKSFKKVKSSFSVILSFKSERTIFVYHGLEDYGKLKIPQNLKANFIYLGPLGRGYEKLYQEAIALAAEKNFKIVLNPGSLQIRAGKEKLASILRVCQILFVNKEEAEKLVESYSSTLLTTGGYPVEKSLLENLKKLGPEIVVITDGPKGAYVYDGKEMLKAPPFPHHRVELTGAGDAFSSAFLAAQILGEDLRTSLKWGLINGALAVEKVGAQTNLATKSKIEKLILKVRSFQISKME